MRKTIRAFDHYREEVSDSLWREAEVAGISRRRFLTLLSMGGATAILSSCASPATRTVTSTLASTTTATATATVTTTAPSAARPIVKPLPEQFFIPIGATNAETRLEQIADRGYLMPNSLFFVRSHSSSPIVDPKTWMLSIEGDGVTTPMQISYDELLRLPSVTITRYVECAGNGRSFYDTLLNNPAQGSQWKLGAYGIAEWTGVRLSEILNRAGIRGTAVDVMPTGIDTPVVQRPMPVAKAMMDDTLVAYMMNGNILPIDHGFPARVLTPAWVGIANIKWVSKITVSQTQLYSDKNTTSYILEGPDYPPQPPAIGQILSDNSMKSAICLPWPATLSRGSQRITGFAWSPFGKIARVEVSLDNQQTYQPATLTGLNIERAGSRWEFTFNAAPGITSLTPRATDDQGNTQIPISQQKWNRQGYVFAAVVPHPVTVT